MLPPLSALRCFEVASQAKNFSVAADILCITPSAVSHQIKTLEVFLGRQLFVRNNRRMQLTHEGEIYARKLSQVFIEIEEATSRLLSSSQAPRLVVQVSPSLAHSWLVPKLADFVRRYSQVRIQLVTDPNVDQSIVNCEIRYGHGKWPNVEAQMLWVDKIRPLVSRAGPKVSDLDDLAKTPLIHTRSRQRGWKAFFDRYKLSPNFDQISLSFDRTGLALEAAVAGLGVALESPLLASKLIRDGVLRMPLGSLEIDDEAYYFVHPQGEPLDEVGLFKSWILEQAAKNQEQAELDLKSLPLSS
jgi:LysR family glycine cleavage system transcriptional activator